jgi:sterol desaturase/sphingolipid hydroxylase (fatty acid hydroxylase superfamily)
LHANIGVGFGRMTRIIASPHFHHWHHDKKLRGNFGSVLTCFDSIFGTYRLPKGFPSQYGCDEPVATTWWGQLALRRSTPAKGRSLSAA